MSVSMGTKYTQEMVSTGATFISMRISTYTIVPFVHVRMPSLIRFSAVLNIVTTLPTCLVNVYAVLKHTMGIYYFEHI